MNSDHNTRLRDKTQLIDWFAQQAKPKSAWRIGTEHEKFLFRKGSLRPIGYEGEHAIGQMFALLTEKFAMTPIYEKGQIIALKDQSGGSITLEPGGQLELSGAPLASLHESCRETGQHLSQMRAVNAELDMCMLGVGFQPLWRREDIDWMPKGRYQIMRNYMPKKGNLGLDMMLRTCTVQVNLDYADEADMIRKFRISLALQPVATALFANSPFREGQLSGYKSTRALCWTDTDPDRCGVPTCVFDADFGYEKWVEYVLDVPMYFVHRGDEYIDLSGQSFRTFMAGALPDYADVMPRIEDFEDHLTTVFPEVRLKGFLEMRGADSGSWCNICALPAFWVGLLYDETALHEAEALTSGITPADIDRARLEVAREGLSASYHGRPMLDFARDVLAIADRGLAARHILDETGADERKFLAPLHHIAETGLTNADIMIDRFHNAWQGDVKHIFHDYHY